MKGPLEWQIEANFSSFPPNFTLFDDFSTKDIVDCGTFKNLNMVAAHLRVALKKFTGIFNFRAS